MTPLIAKEHRLVVRMMDAMREAAREIDAYFGIETMPEDHPTRMVYYELITVAKEAQTWLEEHGPPAHKI